MDEWACPACDRIYQTKAELVTHLKKAVVEPLDTENHAEVVDLEDWTDEGVL